MDDNGSIPTKFHPPKLFNFPKRKFGITESARSFQPVWCIMYDWLHYDVTIDAAFCHLCITAEVRNKLDPGTKRDIPFMSKGFTYWKNAINAFNKHSTSPCHNEAKMVLEIPPNQVMEESLNVVEPECEVEKIVDVRNVDGKYEYFLKWKGHANSANTWEPEDNLNCPALLQKFLDSRAKELAKKKKAEILQAPIFVEVDENDPRPRGFDRGLQPEKILGALRNEGEFFFLMKWRGGGSDLDLVPALQANVKCPQVVIAFYEERLTWCEDADLVPREAELVTKDADLVPSEADLVPKDADLVPRERIALAEVPLSENNCI